MNQNQKMRAAIDTVVLPFLTDMGFCGSYPDLEKETDGIRQTVSFRPSKDGCAFTVTVNNGTREITLPGTYGGAFRFGVQYRHLSFSGFPFAYRGIDPDAENAGAGKWNERKVLSGAECVIDTVAKAVCRQLIRALF